MAKQQQKQKSPEPQPEPEPEPEAEPAVVEAAEESQPAEQPDEDFVDGGFTATESTPAEGKKIAEALVEFSVVTADVDTDLDELEKFVRGIEYKGLTWHGSKVTDHVFGLKKLNIVCKCREDVSLDAVCQQLEKNSELVGSASIESFTC